jgi:hypothetical protein
VLERPADEWEDLVAGGLGGDVRVGVEAVKGAHSREPHVAKDVLGDQWRPEQQDRVGGEDREHDPRHRQLAHEHEHEHVARAHEQSERLEAARAQAHVQALQRARQPWWPATAAPRHVLRRFAGRAGARQEDRRDDSEQAEATEHPSGR